MLTNLPVLQKLRGRLLENELLADYTSWRVGGEAELVYIPADIDDLSEFLQHLPLDLPVFLLGLGSNVLIRDGGLDGAVVITNNALNRITQLKPDIVRVEAGVPCMQFARYAARMGLAGVEFLAGIPGTVGGALAMNAGCYGSETWQKVHCVETINRAGHVRLRTPSDYEIAYRSVKGPQAEWFVAGHFELESGDKTQLLANIRVLLEKRHVSHPAELSSCCAVFRNPPGGYAAQLIEESGLKKKAIGGAYISEIHTNFIINDGSARASDIEALISHVRDTVYTQQNIRLNLEVCIIGKVAS